MWLKRVNAAGGIDVGGKKNQGRAGEYDYQSDDQRAAAAGREADHRRQGRLPAAPFGSGHTKVVAGVAERYRDAGDGLRGSSESVFDQGYKYLFGTLAPNAGVFGTW